MVVAFLLVIIMVIRMMKVVVVLILSRLNDLKPLILFMPKNDWYPWSNSTPDLH